MVGDEFRNASIEGPPRDHDALIVSDITPRALSQALPPWLTAF
jgi:hypothetical protein